MSLNQYALEKLLPKAGHSVYLLVRMAATRALELSEGKKPLVSRKSTDKLTSTALDEISSGLVVHKASISELVKFENKDVSQDEEGFKEEHRVSASAF